VASLIVPGLNAQPIERPFKIGVLFGPAFTIGKSESSDLDSSLLYGSAKTGISAAITLTYRFPKSIFGIYGIGSWQRNPVDSKEFAKQYFPIDPGPVSIVVNSDPLNTWKFLAGPDIKLPLNRDGKFSINFGIGAGVLEAIAPNYTINSYYTNGYTIERIDYHYGGRLPLAFCYQLSSGFNYQINRLWSLVLNASYTHSTPGYKEDYEYNGIPFHYTYTYPVSSLNVLAGVSYSL
jgi:hypothetical protein